MSTVKSIDIHGEVRDVPIADLGWRPSAYAIVIKDDAILLCPQFGNKHDLPGGGIELGEMPEEAVVRETKEETGIDVVDPKLLEVHSTFFSFVHSTNQSFQSIMIYYACTPVGGELSTDGFDEFEQEYAEMAEWVPISQLDTLNLASSHDWRHIVKQHYENTRN